MRRFRIIFAPAFLVGWSLLSLAGGCDGPSGGELDAANKKNIEDELKATQNAQKQKPGRGI